MTKDKKIMTPLRVAVAIRKTLNYFPNGLELAQLASSAGLDQEMLSPVLDEMKDLGEVYTSGPDANPVFFVNANAYRRDPLMVLRSPPRSSESY